MIELLQGGTSYTIKIILNIIILFFIVKNYFIEIISPPFNTIIIIAVLVIFLFFQLVVDIHKLKRVWNRWRLRNIAIKRSIYYEEKPESKFDSSVPAPFYSIERISVKNYKGIRDIKLDVDPGASWIFLTGENGYGKTILLQSVGIALYGKDSNTFSYFEQNKNAELEISVVSPKWSHKIFNAKYSNDRFRFLSCYGVNRVTVFSEDSQTESGSPLSNLFDPQTTLKNIEARLINWNGIGQNNLILSERLEVVKQKLSKLLNLSKIEIKPDDRKNQVIYYEKDKNGKPFRPVNSKDLAVGYRAILNMIGDLFINFYDMAENKSIIDPKDFKGIVIIDEFELHLHPKWQRKLPMMLSSVFPQIQFIVSTHSPIPLLGAPEKSIFLNVERDLEFGIIVHRLKKLEKEIKYLLPNTILTSDIFDMDEIESIMLDNIDDIKLENKYNEIERNKELNERLKKYDSYLPDNLFKE